MNQIFMQVATCRQAVLGQGTTRESQGEKASNKGIIQYKKSKIHSMNFKIPSQNSVTKFSFYHSEYYLLV
jgi:hypothetical protein